jgi:hypothetical protein
LGYAEHHIVEPRKGTRGKNIDPRGDNFQEISEKQGPRTRGDLEI